MIDFTTRVRVLENPNEWEGIEVGEIYEVHGEMQYLLSIRTVQFPRTGAFLYKDWVELVSGGWQQ